MKGLEDMRDKCSGFDGLAGCDGIQESDFYPPEDGRLYRSGVDDVPDGDCFDGYAREFWEFYEDDIYN